MAPSGAIPLPLTAVLKVEVHMPDGHWVPIEATMEHCIELSDDPPTMGVCIECFWFYSQAIGDGYYPSPDRDEVAELYEEMSEG